MPRYKDPVLQKIIDLMEAHGPAELKGRWGIGESMNLSAGSLPQAFVSYDTVQITDASSGTIEFSNNVVITVVVDMKGEFQSPVSNVESHNQVIELIARRDEDLKIRTDSIVGCLREHQDVTPNLWIDDGMPTMIDYGIGIEKRGPGIVTAEASVHFVVTNEQRKPEFY